MDTPLKNRSRRVPHSGTPQETAGKHTAQLLGSLTLPGTPDKVAEARSFIASTLAAGTRGCLVDADVAMLLTSEVVTNAILHTSSGAGGTVTVAVAAAPDGVVIKVIDDGAAGAPVVKEEVFAANGHGLFLVQQLAARWGYLRDPAGTTVWFHLPADEAAQPGGGPPGG